MTSSSKLMRLLKKNPHPRTNESQGAPHQALANYDVLCMLFEENYAHCGGVLRTVDLRNCALVCRSFSEPALRTMWQIMPTPTALWWLLAYGDSQFTPWIPTTDLCNRVRIMLL